MRRMVIHTLGAAVVACALALPAVGAERPDDRAGMLGVGGVAATTQSAATPSGRIDGRELPDSVDLVPTPSTTMLVVGDGFDWSDAGIGLAAGLGLALVTGGALAGAQHGRRLRGAS